MEGGGVSSIFLGTCTRLRVPFFYSEKRLVDRKDTVSVFRPAMNGILELG